MVVIKKKNTEIPIEFGEFTLYFYKTDENLHKFEKVRKMLLEESKKLTDDNAIDFSKNLLEKATNDLFGKGAFEKVYNFADKSIFICLDYLIQVFAGISDELNIGDMTVTKYLNA